MLAIFLAAAQGYTSNMATFLIIFTVNTVLIFSLIGFLLKKVRIKIIGKDFKYLLSMVNVTSNIN